MNQIQSFLISTFIYLFPIATYAQNQSYDRTIILTYFQNMDFENGLNWLKEQPINEYNKAYLMDVGYCYYMIEMPLEARNTYKKIYDAEPMDFHANLFLATIYDNLIYNKNDSAIVHYKNLVTIQPEPSKFWYLAGRALNSEKEYDSAFHYLEKAFELKPSSGNIVVAYANALQRKKEEVKEMDTSYYIFHDPVDLYLAGKIYDDQNSRARAFVYYKKYLSENKKPASPLEVKLENYIKEYLKP